MKWLIRFAAQRALAKGSGRFATLAVVLGLLRVMRKLLGAEERTMYKRNLKPGEVLVIRDEKVSQ